MSLFTIVLLAAVAALTLYGIAIYNALVTLKHNVSKAWANIDVLLKQRHDELPKLVEVCKQYRDFEQSTLQRVVEARSRVQGASQSQDMAALGAAETGLRASLAQLFAVAEAYPELLSNQQFLNLQDRISALESAIAEGGAAQAPAHRSLLSELLTRWKRDQPALLTRFDLGGNGHLDDREWALVRSAAHREATAQGNVLRASQPHAVMGAGTLGRPFILSNFPPEQLARRWVWWFRVQAGVLMVHGVAWTFWLRGIGVS